MIIHSRAQYLYRSGDELGPPGLTMAAIVWSGLLRN